MRLNLRIIGKFCLLLAICGFFMPVACDMNAFELVEYVDSTSAFFIISLFIFAVIGFSIGIFLLAKKAVPIFIDWIVALLTIIFGIVLISRNELELQYGAYFSLVGFILSFVFLFAASLCSDNKTFSQTLTSIYEGIKKLNFLLVAAIFSGLLIIISIIYPYLILFLFIPRIFNIPVIICCVGLAANIFCLFKMKKIFSFVTVLLYLTTFVFSVINFFGYGFRYVYTFTPGRLFGYVSLFFLISAIFCIIDIIKNKGYKN